MKKILLSRWTGMLIILVLFVCTDFCLGIGTGTVVPKYAAATIKESYANMREKQVLTGLCEWVDECNICISSIDEIELEKSKLGALLAGSIENFLGGSDEEHKEYNLLSELLRVRNAIKTYPREGELGYDAA